MAKKDANREIKALKFSDTEVFKNIIPLKKVTEVLIDNNRPRNTFTSPLEVSKEIFDLLYKIGKELQQ